VSKKTEIVESAGPRWNIDLKWLEHNGRSFTTMTKNYACPHCRSQVKDGKAQKTFSVIKDCCSKKEGFFTPLSPILDSTFRLFLANGNQPLSMEEITQELGKKRGDSYQSGRVGLLARLLKDEQYYGIRQIL
jgi:hypothetical protein